MQQQWRGRWRRHSLAGAGLPYKWLAQQCCDFPGLVQLWCRGRHGEVGAAQVVLRDGCNKPVRWVGQGLVLGGGWGRGWYRVVGGAGVGIGRWVEQLTLRTILEVQ